MSETGQDELTENQDTASTPDQDPGKKERFHQRISWVANERERLNKGEITPDIFDANIAMEIETRETRLKADAQLIESLREQIYKDSLAEAESEEALQMYLDELVQSGECFGLILGDIDHFRDVNTEAGHQRGDTAIIKVAERMSKALRIADDAEKDETRNMDRFFRRHGDEFAIIIRDLTPDMEGKKQLKEIMERVRSEVEKEPIELEINGIPTNKSLTVSLGGAVTPPDQRVNPEKFIHLVDVQGLYQAKDEGRNTTFVVNYDQPSSLAA